MLNAAHSDYLLSGEKGGLKGVSKSTEPTTSVLITAGESGVLKLFKVRRGLCGAAHIVFLFLWQVEKRRRRRRMDITINFNQVSWFLFSVISTLVVFF